jgi:hypothetical protein
LPADRRRAAAPTIRWTTIPGAGANARGEVHDNYAAALGGIAGHAGLFGSAAAVGGSGVPSCAARARPGRTVRRFRPRWSRR